MKEKKTSRHEFEKKGKISFCYHSYELESPAFACKYQGRDSRKLDRDGWCKYLEDSFARPVVAKHISIYQECKEWKPNKHTNKQLIVVIEKVHKLDDLSCLTGNVHWDWLIAGFVHDSINNLKITQLKHDSLCLISKVWLNMLNLWSSDFLWGAGVSLGLTTQLHPINN